MYKNMYKFYMTNELETALSKLISEKEKKDYICKKISVTIPEHTKEIYGYTGNVIGMSGAERAYLDKHYGELYDKRIPAQEYKYIVVMERQAYQYFKNFSFKDIQGIEGALKALSIFFNSYYEYFNSKIFYEKFPYLEHFFTELNDLRTELGEEIDIKEDILQKVMKNH